MSGRWIETDYPSKKRVLASRIFSSPDPSWFEPVYKRVILLRHHDEPRGAYGLVRVYGDAEPFRYEVELFDNRDALGWALDIQWSGFPPHRDERGERYDVLFFEPDQTPNLKMVVEPDDEPEDADDEDEL